MGDVELPASRWDTSGGEAFRESVVALSSLVPCVGSVLSAIASGRLVDRKLARVTETIDFLRFELGELRADVDEQYVASEDFEELLELAMRRAADERGEEKRRLYARFLAHGMTDRRNATFEENVRFLRTIEELQPVHVEILRILSEESDENRPQEGVTVQTMQHHLRSMDESDINERMVELGIMGAVTVSPPFRLLNPRSPMKTMDFLTPYGRRLLSYITRA